MYFFFLADKWINQLITTCTFQIFNQVQLVSFSDIINNEDNDKRLIHLVRTFQCRINLAQLELDYLAEMVHRD